MTVPVGLYPPLTVAWSAIELPTVALAGCWLVLIDGLAGVMVTGSSAVPLVTELVVGVAVVGGDPVVGARRGGGVARRGGHAAGERLGVGEQRRAGRRSGCCRG